VGTAIVNPVGRWRGTGCPIAQQGDQSATLGPLSFKHPRIEFDDGDWQTALRWAGAFLAGFQSAGTRKSYRRDLHCWFALCATRYRRIATLSSWFRWLEDEDVTVGNPAARVRRPQRHRGPQPWLNRNQLTDLLAAGEDEGGDSYALVCLLGLNGLRVSEACAADVTDLSGSRYQPMLLIVGKGDKPAEVVLNPRTQQAVDQAVAGRDTGPLLRNEWRRPMRPHNAAAVVRRLARAAGITPPVTPHALRRSYITIGLLQGVPLRDMQRAARHTKADTTVGYDQSERSFHKDPTFVLMTATAR
jgi:integrase/recombinase XerD